MGAITIYQNKAGNNILMELAQAGCKEDVVMVADFIISQTLAINTNPCNSSCWFANIELDLNQLSRLVHPLGSGPSAHASATARLRYKARLEAAYNTLHSVEEPISLVSAATAEGNTYRISMDYRVLKRLEDSRIPSPLVASSNLYRLHRKRSIYAFFVNRFLLIDRKMNYKQRGDEYIIPISLLYRFTPLPDLDSSAKDNRGWRRGRTSWVDYVLKPAIEGCGLYQVLDVSDHEVKLCVTSEQLAAENQNQPI